MFFVSRKPVAELLDDNRLVIWDFDDAQKIYNDGFYGKPLGEPRPQKNFENPLLIDPVEALYLLKNKKIKIVKGNKSISQSKLKKIGENTFSRFNEKYRVYQDLRSKGYVVTPGIKYGSDFAVYENGPGLDHAPYIIQIISSEDHITATEIVKAGRLATTVRKSFILAIVNKKILFLEFKWWRA